MRMTICCLVLISTIFVLFSVTSCAKPVGGSCKYEVETGYAKIVGIGDTINSRVQVVFNFYSNVYLRLPAAIYVDSECVKNIKVQTGNKYGCTRKAITEGSCNPLIYVFDTIPCFNAQ